jgi:membrane-associated phospholipid phosphatase
MSRARLAIAALTCVFAITVLALAVAHGREPYGFEDPALNWLGPRSARNAWAHLAELLATPTIAVVLVLSLVTGLVRGALLRVVLYAALAAATLLINDHVIKPLVDRTYYGELSFPSGNVTAVSATALAMWLALGPRLRTWARWGVLVCGVVWTLLMSLAVVGAQWHTPLDAVGSVLLSVGILTGAAALFEPTENRGRPEVRDRDRVGAPQAT